MRKHGMTSPLLLACLLLGGCAGLSQDGGANAVSAMTAERTGQTVRAQPADDASERDAEVARLIAQPLMPDTAVRLALLNNRSLQASLAELRMTEADAVQAGRLRNPGFHFSRLHGDDTEIDRGILFDLSGLLTLPLRSDIGQRRFQQATLQTAADVIALAADTRSAYFKAVAAQQDVAYAERVLTSAEAGAELAMQMARVGNWSQLDQAREQLFLAEARAQLAAARQQSVAAREQLTRLLGLFGTQTAYVLPDRLPDLPPSVGDMRDVESLAIRQRLDLQIAKRDAEATAQAWKLTKATGFVNVFDAGYINKSETGRTRQDGYEISFELPIFDWGDARNAKAEAAYMRAVHRTADIAIHARSEVRERYAAYRTAYDLAVHYRDEVLPLRKRVSDEMLLRYNGMLASVFELLSDAREQAATVHAAIAAQRDFWLAETALQASINGGRATAAND
ncbi:MAG TPA: TolC family protein [Oxalicibacterium sp.]|nr:TolC family protein [Oxalicibacterium sp.]